MTRPSRNQDRLLIEAGKKLLPELGASGMSLQKVADEAGVNLGMFNYHFKTKANFIRKVLESIKEDALNEAQFETTEDGTSIERLRNFLVFKGQKFRDQGDFVLNMFRDFLNQDPDISELVLADSNQQNEFLQSMIKNCQADGYIDSKLSVEQIIMFCNISTKGPVIMSTALARLEKDTQKTTKTYPMTNVALAEFVDMTLRGIEPKREN